MVASACCCVTYRGSAELWGGRVAEKQVGDHTWLGLMAVDPAHEERAWDRPER